MNQEQKALVALARVALAAKPSEVDGLIESFRSSLDPSWALAASKASVFVTLSTPPNRLRGCIGTLEATAPVYETVALFARKSAFEDPRFPAVRREELSRLQIRISVLGPFERLTKVEDIAIGKHGLMVRSGNQRGLLLAEVATQYHWDAPRFVEETCKKAGLHPAGLDTYEFSYFSQVTFGD